MTAGYIARDDIDESWEIDVRALCSHILGIVFLFAGSFFGWLTNGCIQSGSKLDAHRESTATDEGLTNPLGDRPSQLQGISCV